MFQKIRSILKQSGEFYPEYLLAHSDAGNRLLHFIGATAFYTLLALTFILHTWWLAPLAVFAGYLLPGIGHRFLQHNHSFRGSKPVLCVICATRLYADTLLLKTGRKIQHFRAAARQ
jgi:hypothetical protein